MNIQDERLQHGITALGRVRQNIAGSIVGQSKVIDLALIALLCEGHVLFEGVPGLGKTLLVRSLAASLGLRFSRIQFTPDLMPSDVTGSTVITGSAERELGLRFERGPIFANLVLADEINRASPKTQSALLEAMQERSVTVRGEQHPVPRPFQVLATQNPLEMEGTYPLPEAQVDRFFFKILVQHPDHAELVRIIEQTTVTAAGETAAVMDAATLEYLQAAVREVVVPPALIALVASLVMLTQPERADSPEKVRRYVRWGAGPRAAQAIVLAAKARALMEGRVHAGLVDIAAVLVPALRHRVALNFDGHSENISVDALSTELFASLQNDGQVPVQAGV